MMPADWYVSRIAVAPTWRARRMIASASMMEDVRNRTCEKATTAVDSSIASSMRSVLTVRSSSAGTTRSSNPAATCARNRWTIDGKSIAEQTIRFRAPDGRTHDSATICAVVTFSCMLTVPAGAPMTRAILLPTSVGISHQRSSQPRTPRVAHVSA
jgi:hypothetical protein